MDVFRVFCQALVADQIWAPTRSARRTGIATVFLLHALRESTDELDRLPMSLAVLQRRELLPDSICLHVLLLIYIVLIATSYFTLQEWNHQDNSS